MAAYWLWMLGVFILLWIFVIVSSLKETFVEIQKDIVLTSQKLNVMNVLKNQPLLQQPNTAWNYVLFKLTNQQPLDIFKKPRYVTLDLKDQRQYASSYKYQRLPMGYFIILTHPSKASEFSCGFDWTNRRIGYMDRTEKNMIDAILFGYRTYAKLIPIDLDQLSTLETLFDTIDVMVLYVIPNSPMIQLLKSQALNLLNVDTLDINRLKLTYPQISKEVVSLEDLFGSDRKLQFQTPTVTLLSAALVKIDLQFNIEESFTPQDSSFRESFISRLSMSKEFTDKNFKCMGDESVQSKFLCDSPYNSMGEPKNMPTTWDKPCQQNSDCPFYQANKNYPNTRGKCLSNGTCEMPIGVLRLAYTKYLDVDPYAPFCYQCSNPKDPGCCERQDRLAALQKQNPNTRFTYLKSGDYAFENDQEDREEASLPTVMFLSDP